MQLTIKNRKYTHWIQKTATWLAIIGLAIPLNLILQIAMAISTPTTVVINEFSSAGTTDEWVELLNTTSASIDLGDTTGGIWKLKKLVDRTISPATETDLVTLSGLLPANGILVFSATTNHIDDSGDSIGLYQGTNLVSRVTYGTVADTNYVNSVSTPLVGESASLIPPVTWAITATPTMGWLNGTPAKPI